MKLLLYKLLKIYKYLFNKKEELFFTNDLLNSKCFSIGEYTYGQPNILYHDSGAYLKIGKFCSIAKNVTLMLGGNHRTDWYTTYPFFEVFNKKYSFKKINGHPSTKGDILIGNDVWIGRGATIMSGVRIENGAVIGANSVVTKNIGPYEIWAGNPCKFIKKRFSDNEIEILQNMCWWEIDDIQFILESVYPLISSSEPDNLKKAFNNVKKYKTKTVFGV